VSPRRFDGWEPTEVHEHFDAAGNLTGTTVITREAEWDDETRGRVLRLAEYERSLCACGCGYPIDVAHDPKAVIGVGSYTCMAQRAVEVKKRQDEAEHKGKDDKPRRDGSRWNDGLHYYAVPHEG
jgi:hypothetical protein